MKDWHDFLWPNYGLLEYRFLRGGNEVGQQWHSSDAPRVESFDRAGWDVYVGVLPRMAYGDSESSRTWDPEILWADLDDKDFQGGHSAALTTLLGFPVPASAIVDSGHGYHAYWRLDRQYPWREAEPVLRGIARWLNGDHVYDKARILRVPGTHNWKDPGKPIPVRLLRMDTIRRYRLSDFYEVVEERQTREPRQYERRGDAPDWLQDLINTEPPNGARSETEFKAGIWLARLGYTDEEILGVLMNSPVGAKAQERGERWAQAEVERIRRKA